MGSGSILFSDKDHNQSRFLVLTVKTQNFLITLEGFIGMKEEDEGKYADARQDHFKACGAHISSLTMVRKRDTLEEPLGSKPITPTSVSYELCVTKSNSLDSKAWRITVLAQLHDPAMLGAYVC